MCFQPIAVKTKIKTFRSVPCGSCPECLEVKRMEWFVRLWNEAKAQNSASFVTLTYSDEPAQGVNKKDVQDFLKRFRSKISDKIKYYLVSEYGEKKLRAHYHMLLFGYNGPDTVIVDAWKHGHVHVGRVSPSSINYVAKYHVLKNFSPKGKNKPFMLVSKHMGLSYINKKSVEFHNKELITTIQVYDKKFPMPRYYKEKIFKRSKRDLINSFIDSKADKENQIYEVCRRYGYERTKAIEFLNSSRKNRKEQFRFKQTLTHSL